MSITEEQYQQMIAAQEAIEGAPESITDIAAKSLGDSTSYAVFTDTFDPMLLNPMPRFLAREQWGITGEEFVGYDVWHCHEATFLLDNGYPVAGTLKFVYPANSKYMVESKSAKLYLNSFDMCRMGPTLESASRAYEKQVKRDLEDTVGAQVDVRFHSSSEYNMSFHPNPLEGYSDIHEVVADIEQQPFTDFFGQEHHVIAGDGPGETKFFTNALRSRCRHTKQKDTGLAAIYHNGLNGHCVDELSVFRQIVGLREVNEFHEFCAEKIFVEIKRAIHHDDPLCVSLLYSRRGSLDINPVRASTFSAVNPDLINAGVLTAKVQGQ